MKTIKELESIATAKGYSLDSIQLDALYESGLKDWEGFYDAMELRVKYLEDIAREEEHGTT